MLTIFSTPKPFRAHVNTIQRNAIQSWILLDPGVEVILFGDDEGSADICKEFGIRHEPVVRRDEHGLKFMDYLFGRAQEIASHSVLCYVNCDIILMSDFRSAVHQVSKRFKAALMVGRRWDVDVTAPWDFRSSNWEGELRRLVRLSGQQRPGDWVDYFVFKGGLFSQLLPLVIGRVAWDHWLIWKARAEGGAVIDASRAVMAVHQNHDYSYHPSGAFGVWNDEVANRNREVAGGHRHLYTMEDATHTLGPQGITYNWGQWRRTVDETPVFRAFLPPLRWLRGGARRVVQRNGGA
jgi:hypothetical protein